MGNDASASSATSEQGSIGVGGGGGGGVVGLAAATEAATPTPRKPAKRSKLRHLDHEKYNGDNDGNDDGNELKKTEGEKGEEEDVDMEVEKVQEETQGVTNATADATAATTAAVGANGDNLEDFTPRRKMIAGWEGMKRKVEGLLAREEDRLNVINEGEGKDAEMEDAHAREEDMEKEEEEEQDGEEHQMIAGGVMQTDATNDGSNQNINTAAAAATSATPTEATAQSPVVAAASSLLRLVTTNGLRLPSQHTPQPPKTPAIPTNGSDGTSNAQPPPSGGRRLVFDTTAHAPIIGQGRMTRAQQLHQQKEEQQKQQQQRRLVLQDQTQQQPPQKNQNENQPPSPPPPQRYPLLFIDQFTSTFSKDVKLYTKTWCIVLFSLYGLFIMASMMGSNEEASGSSSSSILSTWNLREQSMKLSALYGIDVRSSGIDADEKETNGNIIMGDGNATEITIEDETINDGDDEPPAEEIIVEVSDPTLLQQAKAKLRAQRMNEHKIQKFDAAIAQVQAELDLLNTVSEEWKTLLPDVHAMVSSSGESSLSSMTSSRSDYNVDVYNERFQFFYSSLEKKWEKLNAWEEALFEAEEAAELLMNGELSIVEFNEVLRGLSKASMVPASSTLLDVSKIHLPGEGCKGSDYIIPEKEDTIIEDDNEEDEEEVAVVGGMDVNALDFASDTPVQFKDAQTARDNLLNLAQSTAEALIAPNGPSATHALRWVQQILKEECKKQGVDSHLPLNHEPIGLDTTKTLTSTDGYTAGNAMVDIDRLLEIEDADRTGKFDYASVVHGARVLRRGPYATSLSLYETLPLLNRVLAYTKLRFYGHPPEVALRPSGPIHARGQCWSFQNEWSNGLSSNRRGISRDGIRGDYATLTVSLVSAAFVSEMVLEHLSSNLTSNNSETAVKDFRVVGYEDGRAFGEPWELGTFQYELNGEYFFLSQRINLSYYVFFAEFAKNSSQRYLSTFLLICFV